MCSPRVLTNRGLKAFLTQEPTSDGITTGHVQHATLPYHTPHVTTSPKKQLSCSEPSSLETLHLPPGGDTASPQSSFLKATTHLGSCSFSLASFHIPIYVEFFLLSSLLTSSVSPLSIISYISQINYFALKFLTWNLLLGKPKPRHLP